MQPTPHTSPTDLLITNARVLTLDPSPEDASSNPLGILPRAHLTIRDGRIADLRPAADAPPSSSSSPSSPHAHVIDAAGHVLLPSFIDCHTHLCWAGSRLDEWERKLAGASYLDLLSAGGGIMSTVRAVRAASESQLADLTLERLHLARSLGTTTIEIKSGYGLSTEHELKMLRAITRAARQWPGAVVPTALIGHAIDPDAPSRDAFISRTIDETLPAVHAEFPAITIDAYCEHGAWSLDDCRRLFTRAHELGHPIRVHADQFNSLGMTRLAVELGAVSVDHLEAATTADWELLARSRTSPVILPCCGFHLDNRYAAAHHYAAAARARDALAGPTPPRPAPHGSLCLATNSNPGSAPCLSIPMAIALAVRQCGLSISQAIHAATAAPADLLHFADRGRIRVGHRADLLLLRTPDERDLAYRFGDASLIDRVLIAGE